MINLSFAHTVSFIVRPVYAFELIMWPVEKKKTLLASTIYWRMVSTYQSTFRRTREHPTLLLYLGINSAEPHWLHNGALAGDTVEISVINVDARCSYRVVATELHGAADDHDGDELPAHWAISEKFPGPAGPHASGFSLFLENLIQLAVLDVTASQASQGSWSKKEKMENETKPKNCCI